MIIFAYESTMTGFYMYQSKTISQWVRLLKFRGLYTFCFDDVREAFPSYSPAYISTSLNRLIRQSIIISPAKAFFVIVPTEYALTGIVAPAFFIDQMMRFLMRDYYIALLNAAEFYGAAHQRPQSFTVVNSYPELRSGMRSNIKFEFIGCKHINTSLLSRHKSRTGSLWVSSPELTAIDLVANQEKVGGLNRVCTVLSELLEAFQPDLVDNSLFDVYPKSVYQRLGYIIEVILSQTALADSLYRSLLNARGALRPVPLKTTNPVTSRLYTSRWKVIDNQPICIDE